MKIFWTILTDCYPKSAFLVKSTILIIHKEWDSRKRKRGVWVPCRRTAKRVKSGCLVPWLYFSRHIWL